MSNHTHSTAPSPAPGAAAQPLVGHLVPVSTLFLTASALLVLTIITVAVRYIDIGEFNIWVALGIACIKATLVAMFFMHLRWDRPFNQLVFVGCIVFVALMMGFCIMDTSQYRKEQWQGNAPLVQEELTKNAPEAPLVRFNGQE